MKRMVTEDDIKRIAEESVTPFDPSELIGKFVQIIDYENERPLTEDDVSAILSGTFVNGTLLSIRNPIIFPPAPIAENVYVGVAVGRASVGSGTVFVGYSLNPAEKTITQSGDHKYITIDSYSQYMQLNRVSFINGRAFDQLTLPARPTVYADKSFSVRLANGTTTWIEGNGLYLHVIVFDVGSGNTFTLRFISDSSSPCELDSVTGNFTIPGAKFIQPANMGNVVVIPLDENKFAPDIHAFNTSSGAFTDNITLASVTSDTVTPIG